MGQLMQPRPPANTTGLTPMPPAGGGFSSGGAMPGGAYSGAGAAPGAAGAPWSPMPGAAGGVAGATPGVGGADPSYWTAARMAAARPMSMSPAPSGVMPMGGNITGVGQLGEGAGSFGGAVAPRPPVTTLPAPAPRPPSGVVPPPANTTGLGQLGRVAPPPANVTGPGQMAADSLGLPGRPRPLGGLPIGRPGSSPFGMGGMGMGFGQGPSGNLWSRLTGR